MSDIIVRTLSEITDIFGNNLYMQLYACYQNFFQNAYPVADSTWEFAILDLKLNNWANSNHL